MKPTSIIACLILLFGVGLSGFSQPAVAEAQEWIPHDPLSVVNTTEFELVPGSRLWINGTTTINRFSCEAKTVELTAAAAASASINATVEVPVGGLECGRRKMNRDLRRAMNADSFPEIHYRLESASAIESDTMDDSGVYSLDASGVLTVAGVEKNINVRATARATDEDTYVISGRIPILMTDYSITPPRALRGLIRVRDEITVQFDFVISTTNRSN